MLGDARSSTSSRVWAGAVIVLLLFALAWTILDGVGGANPLADASSRVLAPLQLAFTRASRPMVRALQSLGKLSSLEAENERLRQENAELRAQVISLREAENENETYRRQLNFKRAVPGFQLLSAEVVGYDPGSLVHYVVIDRGRDDGIEVGMPVLSAAGLVGRISGVSAASSKVMLITDPSSSVSGLVQRSRATGIVQGMVGDRLVMRYIPQGDAVAAGDIVLTSGLGSGFPKRLLLGQVVDVRFSDVDMFQEAELVPAASLHDLEAVMVLRSFQPIGSEGTIKEVQEDGQR